MARIEREGGGAVLEYLRKTGNYYDFHMMTDVVGLILSPTISVLFVVPV